MHIIDEQFNGTLTGMEKEMKNVDLETFYPCLNLVFSFISLGQHTIKQLFSLRNTKSLNLL